MIHLKSIKKFQSKVRFINDCYFLKFSNLAYVLLEI